MQVLEKILEEIEEMRDIMESTVAMDCFGKDCEHDDCTVCVCERAMEIIRSHMNDIPDDGWIPVKERLPEDGDEVVLVQVSGKPKKNIEFINAFELATYGEEGWILENYPEWEKPEVAAWRPLPEPYKPNKDISAAEHIMSRFTRIE